MLTGYLQVFGALVFWGLNFVIAGVLANKVPPAALTCWRWLLALLCLSWFLPRLWRRHRTILANWRYYVLAAISGISIYHYSLYRSAETAGTNSISLIAATSGVFVLLINRIRGQPSSWLNVLGAATALFGLAVLVGKGEPRLWLLDEVIAGDLWMLLGAFAWALYSVLSERLPPGSALENHTTCIIFALPLLVSANLLEISWRGIFEVDPIVIACLVYLALFPSVLCYFLWLEALRKLGAERVHSLYYGIPIVAAVEAYLIVDEPLYGYHVVAGLFIITGAILAAQFRQNERLAGAG